MTYEEAQIKVFELTEAESIKRTALLLESYKKAESEIMADIEKVYAKYLTTTDPQDYYNIMIQYDRLNGLLKSVQQTYTDLAKTIGRDIPQISSAAMNNTYYRQLYTLDWFVPAVSNTTVSFVALNTDLVNYTVTGMIQAWNNIAKSYKDRLGLSAVNYTPQTGTLVDLLKKNSLDDLAKLQQTITNGLIQGKSVSQMGSDIRDFIETSKYKAERIALTESGRASSAGDFTAMKEAESSGLDITKMWSSALDANTRQAHASADGQKRPIDEPFSVGGESMMMPRQGGSAKNVINCRCRAITLIDGEVPAIRIGRNPTTGQNEVFSYKDYPTWAKEKGLKETKSGWTLKK